MHLNNKVEGDGKSLAFGGRGTYNPANREKGSGRLCVRAKLPVVSRGRLPGSPAFQSRIRT